MAMVLLAGELAMRSFDSPWKIALDQSRQFKFDYSIEGCDGKRQSFYPFTIGYEKPTGICSILALGDSSSWGDRLRD